MADAFISYSEADRPLAAKLTQALQARGVSVRESDTQDEPAVSRTDDAPARVVLIGHDYWKNKPLQSELQRALETVWKNPGERLVPVVLPKVDFPPPLARWQPVELSGRTAKDFDHAVGEIARLIKASGHKAPAVRPASKEEWDAWEERLSYIETAAKSLKAREAA